MGDTKVCRNCGVWRTAPYPWHLFTCLHGSSMSKIQILSEIWSSFSYAERFLHEGFHYDDTKVEIQFRGWGLHSHVYSQWLRHHTCHTEHQRVCRGACNWFQVSIHGKGFFLTWNVLALGISRSRHRTRRVSELSHSSRHCARDIVAVYVTGV